MATERLWRSSSSQHKARSENRCRVISTIIDCNWSRLRAAPGAGNIIPPMDWKTYPAASVCFAINPRYDARTPRFPCRLCDNIAQCNVTVERRSVSFRWKLHVSRRNSPFFTRYWSSRHETCRKICHVSEWKVTCSTGERGSQSVLYVFSVLCRVRLCEGLYIIFYIRRCCLLDDLHWELGDSSPHFTDTWSSEYQYSNGKKHGHRSMRNGRICCVFFTDPVIFTNVACSLHAIINSSR